jgi:hypothetical protein
MDIRAQLTNSVRNYWRAVCKLSGRAETIRRLLEEISVHECGREAVRAWFRGELTTDPAPKPWFCMWCAEPLTGNRDDAAAHVQQCQSNPLVQQLAAMTADRDEAQSLRWFSKMRYIAKVLGCKTSDAPSAVDQLLAENKGLRDACEKAAFATGRDYFKEE